MEWQKYGKLETVSQGGENEEMDFSSRAKRRNSKNSVRRCEQNGNGL